jgi:hypothetical protein
LNTFNDIKELVSALKREEKLISEMFRKRKSIDYKYSDAVELVEYDENRIEFLIQRAVIRKNDGLLNLDDQYSDFFEQVLDINEEINLAYIDANIKTIRENIDYFLNEGNENGKYRYLQLIKKAFRKTGIITIKSIVDLRRNVENTFKNESNYKNKQLKLENFDQKRTVATSLIQQTFSLINEEEVTFFNRAKDEELNRTIIDLKSQLGECSHNLIEIEKQIIDYLNQIKHQGEFLEKLRKLKYLKDHLTIEVETDIRQILGNQNQVIFESRTTEPLNLSIDFLRESETAFEAICKVAKNHQNRKKTKPELADKIAGEYLESSVEEEIMIDLEEIRNLFMATSENLFNFIMSHDFSKMVSFEERVTIFCQITSYYEHELQVKEDFQIQNGVEYALVYPK